jgi:hypothetical protein
MPDKRPAINVATLIAVVDAEFSRRYLASDVLDGDHAPTLCKN